MQDDQEDGAPSLPREAFLIAATFHEGGVGLLRHIVGDSYRIAPLALDEAKTAVSTGTFDAIKYTLQGAPDGWFVNADNGEITERRP